MMKKGTWVSTERPWYRMVVRNDLDHSRKLGFNVCFQPGASTSTSGCTFHQVWCLNQNVLLYRWQVGITPQRTRAGKEPDHPHRAGSRILRNISTLQQLERWQRTKISPGQHQQPRSWVYNQRSTEVNLALLSTWILAGNSGVPIYRGTCKAAETAANSCQHGLKAGKTAVYSETGRVC